VVRHPPKSFQFCDIARGRHLSNSSSFLTVWLGIPCCVIKWPKNWNSVIANLHLSALSVMPSNLLKQYHLSGMRKVVNSFDDGAKGTWYLVC